MEKRVYTIPQIIAWLWHAWRGNRLQAALNASIGIIGVGVSLALVWAMQRAIDLAAAGGATMRQLLAAVAVMALLTAVEFALGISRTWVKNILGVKAQNQMQQQLFSRLLRSEWSGREAMHSGDVINRLETDVAHVIAFLTETLPSVVSTLAMFCGAFFYLLQMDSWLAVITVSVLPVFLLGSRYYIYRMRAYSRDVRHSDSDVQSLLTETLQHRMVVKTLEADSQMEARLARTHGELRHHVRRRTLFSVVAHLLLNTGFSLTYLIAFLWGLVRLTAGTITFGAMTAFLQLVYRIQGPARDLTHLIPSFVRVFTAAERLMQLEEMPEEEHGEPLPVDAPCGIRFSNVSYRYPGEGAQTVVSHADYDFRPGSCTAVLGETGSGKTTLIRLMLGLLHPTEGTISIYDTAGQTAPLSPRHRCNIVYVPQGNTLLSGTLRDNLRLGNPDATDAEMLAALRKACADFAADSPAGLDTELSELGAGLSEGQAQRIAIARALLRPGSLLLFDESTSALDADTERRLLQQIMADSGKTIVFVTHRTAVVDFCDTVIRTD